MEARPRVSPRRLSLDGAADRPEAGPARGRDVRSDRALAPEVVAHVRRVAVAQRPHRAVHDAGRLFVERHVRPRLTDGQRRPERDPEPLVREQVLGEAPAGAAADAVGVRVEAVEDVEPVEGGAPAAEVVVRPVRVTEHLARLELEPLEVAVAPARVARHDRPVVDARLEREAARPAVTRVPLRVDVVDVTRVPAAERALLEVLLERIGAAPVEGRADAVARHHALEAVAARLRAGPLVDGLLDPDVGRTDGERAEAAAAGNALAGARTV